MSFDRALLVQAKYDSTFSSVLPAGLGYLSEYLTAHKISHDLFDLNMSGSTIDALFTKIERFDPDLIGMSMMSLNYKHNYKVLETLKNKYPNLTIVAGGAHVSTMREEVLRECAAIDYGVVLEGEYTLLELMHGHDVCAIEGLIRREGGVVKYNGDRPFIKDLDTIPFPRYEKFNSKDYSPLMSLFSSRGCPFECTYCPVKLAIGRRFVARSAKSVVDELEYHYAKGRRQFSFRDDNFTLIPDRVYSICDEIELRGLKGLYLMCDNGVRADKIDRKLLSRMWEVGFRMIGLGVEAGVDRILKSLKKSATVEIMETAIKTACDLGYIVELYFLIGAPGETWEDFEKTVSLATKFPVLISSFYHILPYPNTELFEEVRHNKFLLREPEEYLNDGSQRRNTPFIATPEFPEALRKKAFDYAYSATAPHVRAARRDYSQKNTQRKLLERGCHPAIASMLSRMYATSLVQDAILGNAVAGRAIKGLKRHIAQSSMKAG